jgi:hypothetical protein
MGVQQKRMMCEVDLENKQIRFTGDSLGDHRAAAEKRVAALSDMIGARCGFTNRQRRRMNRERNFLHKWRSTWRNSQTLFIEKHLRGLEENSPVEISFQPDGEWSYRVVL